MRIATWNVNSLRARLDKVRWWLERARPDVLMMQETKLTDADAPADVFRELGYELAHHGQGRWNGVGIASRRGLAGVVSAFGEPLRPAPASDESDEQPLSEARMLAADCGGVRVVSVYAPNGRVVDSPFYEAKLAWYGRLARWLAEAVDPVQPLVLGGDFNVAPTDDDVWDPRACHGGTHVSPREREAFAKLLGFGLVDVYRARRPERGRYTWWDYRAGNFHKNFGMRIDHLLATRPLAERVVWAEIDREARKGKPTPSDHAPLIVDVDEPGLTARRRLGRGGGADRGTHLGERLMAGEASGDYPIAPPVAPMLAQLATELPPGEGWLFEPKWDGFRAIVFRAGDALYVQSRDLKPLGRYFPELEARLRRRLPERCVLDGEIVIVGERGLDFDALQMRLHPAASRVKKLAAEIPASYVAFDILADGDEDLRSRPQAERRARLEAALAGEPDGVHLTPCSRDRALAGEWFHRFEGAGLDGVVAKREDAPYQPGKRVMVKVKHARSADCVVAGFRWHKQGPGTHVGSLLLGLFDDQGALHHVGVTSSFTMAARRKLAEELEPLRRDALAVHPWRHWAEGMVGASQRMPGGQSRWSAGKDLSWEPLRVERVCEVKYDHLQGDRFRHAAVFLRWREDKPPADCRYDQLEVTPPAELALIFRRA